MRLLQFKVSANTNPPTAATLSAFLYPNQWLSKSSPSTKKVGRLFKSWIPWVHPDQVPDAQHFKLDNFLNGWYVDPAKLCTADPNYGGLTSLEIKDSCFRNPDGTYNINLIIEFSPQRYFYVGLIVSITTLIACLTYLGNEFLKRRKAHTPGKYSIAAKKPPF